MAKQPIDNPGIAGTLQTLAALTDDIEKQIDGQIPSLNQKEIGDVLLEVKIPLAFLQSPLASADGKMILLSVIEKNLKEKYKAAGWLDLTITQKYRSDPPYNEFLHYEAVCEIILRLFN